MSDKPAGLRTHMLVAATSAMLVGLSDALVWTLDTQVETDPLRIVQAIVIGIGFLGAGTIIQLKEHERIEGLTTGATLLLAAGLGICVAAGQWVIASGTALLALIVMTFLGRLEKRRKRPGNNRP